PAPPDRHLAPGDPAGVDVVARQALADAFKAGRIEARPVRLRVHVLLRPLERHLGRRSGGKEGAGAPAPKSRHRPAFPGDPGAAAELLWMARASRAMTERNRSATPPGR